WVGTDSGAGILQGDEFHPLNETQGIAITAIASTPDGWVLASQQGVVFLARNADAPATRQVRPEQNPLLTAGDDGSPLALNSIALAEGKVIIGSSGRGLLVLETERGGERVREVGGRARPFFIKAMQSDSKGKLWVASDIGIFDGSDLNHLKRAPVE